MRARSAVSVIFFLNGAVLASWVAQIPAVKTQHRLPDERLGLLLLAMSVGAVLALPLAAWLIARWGSRRITGAAAIAFCLALPLPLGAPAVSLVGLTLAVLGAANAVLDVSMNAHAVLVEEQYGRPIMPAFHALFSIGGIAGALVAAVAMAGGVTSLRHVIAVSAAAVVIVAGSVRWLLPAREVPGPAGSVFAWPSRPLLSLGLLTFCGLLVEGAIGDWSAVYLRDALGTTASVAASGFAAFSLAMAIGRFAGSALAGRFGARSLLRLSGAVAGTGLAGALLLASPWAALVGFALVGFGMANVIPLLFSAAGRVAGRAPGTALAAVATTGYAGFLVGPPLIGFAAGLTGLPVALGVVVACCALIAFGGRRWLPC